MFGNREINEQPERYHMNFEVFVGTSPPGCSNYVLQRTERDHERRYDKEVAGTFRGDFCADDLLKSAQDQQTTIKLMKDVTAMCAEGGFRLLKFVSNSRDVLVSIPEGETRNGLEVKELRLGTLPTEKTIGIHWNLEKEKLSFDVNLKDKTHIKSRMVSTVKSMYDSLRLISQFVLEGRQIIQMLCLNHFACIDTGYEDIQEKWIKWELSLKKIQEIKLDRCYQRNLKKWLVAVCTIFLMLQKVVMGKQHILD